MRTLTPCADPLKYCRWAGRRVPARHGSRGQGQAGRRRVGRLTRGRGRRPAACPPVPSPAPAARSAEHGPPVASALCPPAPPCSVRAVPEWGVLGKRLGKGMAAVAKAVGALPLEVRCAAGVHGGSTPLLCRRGLLQASRPGSWRRAAAACHLSRRCGQASGWPGLLDRTGPCRPPGVACRTSWPTTAAKRHLYDASASRTAPPFPTGSPAGHPGLRGRRRADRGGLPAGPGRPQDHARLPRARGLQARCV